MRSAGVLILLGLLIGGCSALASCDAPNTGNTTAEERDSVAVHAGPRISPAASRIVRAVDRVREAVIAVEPTPFYTLHIIGGLGGQILPCGCSSSSKFGGLDRLATVLARQSRPEPRELRCVVLFAGTFGIGPTAPGSERDQWMKRVALTVRALSANGERAVVYLPNASERRDTELIKLLGTLPIQVLPRLRSAPAEARDQGLLVRSGAMQMEFAALPLGNVKVREGLPPSWLRGTDAEASGVRVLIVETLGASRRVVEKTLKELEGPWITVVSRPPWRMVATADGLVYTQGDRGRWLDTVTIGARNGGHTYADVGELLTLAAGAVALEDLGTGREVAERERPAEAASTLLAAETARLTRSRSFFFATRHQVTPDVPRDPIASALLEEYFSWLGTQFAGSRAVERPAGYAGSQTCVSCHPRNHQEWQQFSHHSSALSTLARIVHQPGI